MCEEMNRLQASFKETIKKRKEDLQNKKARARENTAGWGWNLLPLVGNIYYAANQHKVDETKDKALIKNAE